MLARTIILFVLLITIWTSALSVHASDETAEQLARAKVAYEAGDYKTARRIWSPLAEAGDAGAQTWIGILYYQGEGVPVNKSVAVDSFRRAAALGSADALHNLGVSYWNGDGVEKNHKTAVAFYAKAAGKGHSKSQNNLAYAYDHGLGVDRNLRTATYWYKRAANQGYEPAQLALAARYSSGRGVAEDQTQAYMWACLASGASIWRALIVKSVIWMRSTDEQRTNARAAAAEWAATPENN